MERLYVVNILIENREGAYRQVNELLHDFADVIRLRIGYPVPDENIAIIVLIVKMTNDLIGSLSGKLGQIREVKVKTIPVK